LCWIEYQSDIMWEKVAGKSSDKSDLSRDEAVGLLIDHNRIDVFSRTFKGDFGKTPFTYHLNTEWPLEDQLRFCEVAKVSRLGIDFWLWGASADYFRSKGQTDRLRILRDTTMVELCPGIERLTKDWIRGSMGDFKTIVALLLMLNQPKVTQYVHVAKRRGWIGNKPKPFLSHHNVIVSLDAHARLATHDDNAGDHEFRRRHKVRGHYCHDQTARDYARIAGCVHVWEPMTEEWEPWPDAPLDEREHWKCYICEGKRWWRTAHERGKEKQGFIEHQYQVKA
jgi:hypothetical protein